MPFLDLIVLIGFYSALLDFIVPFLDFIVPFLDFIVLDSVGIMRP